MYNHFSISYYIKTLGFLLFSPLYLNIQQIAILHVDNWLPRYSFLYKSHIKHQKVIHLRKGGEWLNSCIYLKPQFATVFCELKHKNPILSNVHNKRIQNMWFLTCSISWYKSNPNCQNPNSTNSSIQQSLRIDYIITCRSTHPPSRTLRIVVVVNCTASSAGTCVYSVV